MTERIELVVDDERLKGWRPIRRYLVPATWRWRVREVSKVRDNGGLFDGRRRMWVWFDIAEGEGQFEPSFPPYEFEPDQRPDLREIGDALAYIEQAAELPEGDTLRAFLKSQEIERADEDPHEKRFSKDGGPLLSLEDLGLAGLLDHHWRSLWAALPDSAKDQWEVRTLCMTAEVAIAQAYRIGRIVREAELKAEFEPNAMIGEPVKAGAKRGGELRGEQITADAEAWRGEFCKWATGKAKELERLHGQAVSLAVLLTHLESAWPYKGFKGQTVKPERTTLETALEWGRKQKPPVFTKAAAPRGRKKKG